MSSKLNPISAQFCHSRNRVHGRFCRRLMCRKGFVSRPAGDVIVGGIVVGFASQSLWWPGVRSWLVARLGSDKATGTDSHSDGHDDHAGHDHGR